MNKETTSRAAF